MHWGEIMFEETAKGGTESALLQGEKTFGGVLTIYFALLQMGRITGRSYWCGFFPDFLRVKALPLSSFKFYNIFWFYKIFDRSKAF